MQNVKAPSGWINTSPHGSRNVCFCLISYLESDSNSSAFVNCSLVIRSDTTWHLHVNSHPIPSECPAIADCPSHLDSVSTSMLLSRLSTFHTCPGNPEPKFISLASMKRNGEFLSNDNEVVAYLDRNGSVAVNDKCYTSTIRTSKCHLLTRELRCEICKGYRKNLLAQHSRAMHTSAEQPSNKVNYRSVKRYYVII